MSILLAVSFLILLLAGIYNLIDWWKYGRSFDGVVAALSLTLAALVFVAAFRRDQEAVELPRDGCRCACHESEGGELWLK